MKVAIVTDSNSGITQEMGKELGIFVVPMPFMIDGETYYEDINLTQPQFFERLMAGADISTSQPSPGEITDLWDNILTDYDQIVHIPMSSGLSGSCQTAKILADDYEGRVQVVDNHRVSVTQRQSALDAREMAAAGQDAATIREKLDETAGESTIYITVDTLKYLRKGGRVTAAAAALGTLLRIKPVLSIYGEKLDAFSKARTTKQAKTTMITAIQKDLETRFQDPEASKIHLQIAHTQNSEAAAELAGELRELFPQALDIHVDPLSLSVACHIGPGSLAIACTKKLEY